jgi:hypothetical protein
VRLLKDNEENRMKRIKIEHEWRGKEDDENG